MIKYHDNLCLSTFHFSCTLSTNGKYIFIGGKRNRGGEIMAVYIWQETNGGKKLAGTGKFFWRYLFLGWKMEPIPPFRCYIHSGCKHFEEQYLEWVTMGKRKVVI